jgi:hypothetical protein
LIGQLGAALIPVNRPGSRAWAAAHAQARRTLRLTDRWTPLKEHPIQALYFWHPCRFKVNPSGRRSGKTELAKRKGVLRLVQPNRSGGPRRILYGAPTHEQAKAIFWDDLKALVPKAWIRKINETALTIITKWGAFLRVMGLDRPQRVEGQIWDDIFIDEIADCRPRCFELNIRPALSTLGREGNCDLLGVPDEIGPNQVEYEKLWEIGLQWPHADPEICSFHWPSTDIIDPREIAAVKRTLDEFAFRQEYGGQFTRSGGKAVPMFDRTTHVSEFFAEYCPFLPIDWTLDFGTNPAASLICQSYRGYSWVLDEIVLQDSSTDVAARAFIERCQTRGYRLDRIRVFGDAAGRSPHSNVGASDYEILERVFHNLNVEWLQLTANPLVKDTLNAVRGRIVNAAGEVALHVHPRARTLIEDLNAAPWPSDLRQFHALAALRYYVWALYGGPQTHYATAPLGLPAFAYRGREENPRPTRSMLEANIRR